MGNLGRYDVYMMGYMMLDTGWHVYHIEHMMVRLGIHSEVRM